MIKASQNYLVPVLTKLFNHIFTTGTFPDSWRHNFLTPLHKKGDRYNPGNYRGIAVGSNLSKLFCSVLHNRLVNFLDTRQSIPPNQIGYKKNARTSDHIFTLKILIDKFINKVSKNYLYVCFIDFKSAFDTISRKALIYKLIQTDIGGNFVNIIESLYSSVFYCVKLKEGCTNFFSSKIGVKQGCVLSPTLFNIFLRDLPEIFDHTCDPVPLHTTPTSCLMFADDLIVMSTTATGLQCALDKLSIYCKKWVLTVNTSKTKVIIFNKAGRLLKNFNFKYRETTIDVVQQYCYLGIVFSSSGSFRYAIDQLLDKANRSMFKLRQHGIQSDARTSLKLFQSLILPIIQYGCEVWSPYLCKRLTSENFIKICDSFLGDKILVKFGKFILGVSRKTTNISVKAELGLQPILIICIIHAIKYWVRLCNHDQGSLAYIAYCDSASRISEQNNWCSLIKHILDKFGNLDAWVNQESVNHSSTIRSMKIGMYCKYERDIFEAINSENSRYGNGGNKLRTYSKFKSSYSMENYIISAKDINKRRNFTKLRISAHNLMIEMGRYTKPTTPVDQRLCHFCAINSVEDEMHFVTKCDLYKTEREDLFNELNCILAFDLKNMDCNDQFKFIMSCGDGDYNIINCVCKYIDRCFVKRAQSLGF